MSFFHSLISSVGEIALPELQSATVTQTTTNVLDLVFDVAVDITTTGWTIASDGDAISITSVIADDGTTAPKFSLSRVVVPGEVLTLSYDATTGDTAASTGGGLLASITDDAVTNNVHIWLNVEFSGSTIDTTKGTVTNPNSANLTISQNNNLRFVRTTDVAVSDTNANYWESVLSFTHGTFAVVFNRAVGYTNSTWFFKYFVDVNNFITIQPDSGFIVIGVQVSGSTFEYSFTTTVANNNFRIKIVKETNNDIKFYYFNGSIWIQLGTTQNINVGASGKIRLLSNSHASDAVNDRMEFDSIRVTDEDYPTAIPEQHFV